MKTPPAQNSALVLSTSDFDAELVNSVRQMVISLAGEGAAPSHIASDDGNAHRFAAARERLRPQPKITLFELMTIVASAFMPLAIMWLVLVLIIDFVHEGPYWNVLPPLLTITALSAVLYRQVSGERISRKAKELLLPDTLSLALPLLNHKTPMEKAYCEAAAALLRDPAAWGGDATVRNILHDLRDLFQAGKQITARRDQLNEAMSRQTLADGEAEASQLAVRAETARDPDARETYKQSLALLEGRLERMRAMELLRERLEAQEEAVYQALREAQATLSNTNFAVGDMGIRVGGTTADARLTPWSETAYRLRQQTAAVEMAVQEVMVSVGGGSGRGT